MKDGPREVDILSWMGRTALELIGQGGLGYSFDPLVEIAPNEFGEAIKALVYDGFPLIISYLTSISAPHYFLSRQPGNSCHLG